MEDSGRGRLGEIRGGGGGGGTVERLADFLVGARVGCVAIGAHGARVEMRARLHLHASAAREQVGVLLREHTAAHCEKQHARQTCATGSHGVSCVR